ncbi:hypothetical protein [Mycobacterium paraseoulense]|nr:hypothetical protein [Mycobacterium paraseoulense]MCV7394840.1 hypothetical protein [Mycobacterium paraseoulense]
MSRASDDALGAPRQTVARLPLAGDGQGDAVMSGYHPLARGEEWRT